MRCLALRALVFCVATIVAAQAAHSGDGPWSGTLYFGPSSTKYFVAAALSLKLQPTGGMAGLAVDRKLLYLGSDISLAAEGQVTQYFFGHKNTTFALGLGLQFDKLFGFQHTSLSVYDGPSFATDPPYTSIGYKGRLWPAWRKKFLNYVSVELAVGLSSKSKWDGVFRFYHRSGVFGIYSDGDDDGLMIGIGLRRRF